MRRTAFVALLLATCLIGNAALAGADANRANRAQLEQLRGVGPPLAERILAEREREPFRDWADLIARVRGVGPAKARELSRFGLTVDGAPYEAPPLTK